MNTPNPPDSQKSAPSKLLVRSEVLSSLRGLIGQGDWSKADKEKHIQRLQALNAPRDVQDILVRELQNAKGQPLIELLVESLMAIGEGGYLKDKLWGMIEDAGVRDDVKDAAHLVLMHLGDNADPDAYLDYLEDPKALIGRETTRMLELSSENPEALIDFIDFILSLNGEEQQRLLATLHRDYPMAYLVNLYIPLLESDPSALLWEQLVTQLGESRSAKAVPVLERLLAWTDEERPIPARLIKKALKELKISGALAMPERTAALHPISQTSDPYECHITLQDGIGNQAIMLTRKRHNGDILLLSVAINDIHGVMDCFGFASLSSTDYGKISDKFHEGVTKFPVPAEYVGYKLDQALQLNYARHFRIPYEYGCWRMLLSELPTEPPPERLNTSDWVRPEWLTETDNLYQHPDFLSWFLEAGDDADVTEILSQVEPTVLNHAEDALEGPALDALCADLDRIARTLMETLITTDWRRLTTYRLEEAAYLLHCQGTHTFRNLAATEVWKLRHMQEPEHLITGFTHKFGQHCVGEALLRLRMASGPLQAYAEVIENVLDRWGV